MATFVFVHGAFQGGWVWRQVAGLLQEQGHKVHTPTYSGCGYLFAEDATTENFKTLADEKTSGLKKGPGSVSPGFGPHPCPDLNTHIREMGRYLEFEDLEDCILVGHSFSGMICGALMMRFPQRIRQVISVDAVIPTSNCSFIDLAGEQFAQMLKQHQIDDALIRPWPVKVFGVEGSMTNWFESRLRPFPLGSFNTAFPGEFDPAVRPISHITCLNTMSPFIRAMAGKARELSWPVYELDSAHCPMITCPEALTTLLLNIVRKTMDERK